MAQNMGEIAKLQSLIKDSRYIMVFTGAGISTESGISDYRSQGGIWDKFTPVYFQEFLESEEKRILYWQRKLEMWPQMEQAKPNEGHLLLKKLHQLGKLQSLVTQNIDGLHEKSGIPRDIIVNIHGNALEIICLSCGKIIPTEELVKTLDLSQGAPRCAECDGLLKPNTITFGQNLRAGDLQRAEDYAGSCDLCICLGSTLVVHPAAYFPELAKRNGAKLVIITLSETPLDSIADLVIHEKIGDTAEQLSL